MLGKGNVGRPDTPGVSTAEMQRIMDKIENRAEWLKSSSTRARTAR